MLESEDGSVGLLLVLEGQSLEPRNENKDEGLKIKNQNHGVREEAKKGRSKTREGNDHLGTGT